MSTPANIAELDKNGQLHIINVAMDGDYDRGSAGSVLLTAYNSPKKVHQLMELGNLEHVGYTPKQANVYKEAGGQWSDYVGHDLFQLKNRPGNGVTAEQAKANQRGEDKWLSQVENYTHAFGRDEGHPEGEQGQTVDGPLSGEPKDALLHMSASAKWASQYDYLYDDKSGKWLTYGMDDEVKSLSDVIPKHDQELMQKDYQHFLDNPTNPKLPPLSPDKIHQMINKKINDPNVGIKSRLKMDKSSLKANANSVKEARRALKLDGNRMPKAERRQYRETIRIDADPAVKARNTTLVKRETAEIKNLQQIDVYAKAHSNMKLYPNDLKLNNHMGEKLFQQNSSQIFSRFLDQNPEYTKKLHGMYSSRQAQQKLKNAINDDRRLMQDSNRLKGIGLSTEAVRVVINNDNEKLKGIKPNGVYTGDQIEGSADTFKPLSKKAIEQNVKALAPHDKKLQQVLSGKPQKQLEDNNFGKFLDKHSDYLDNYHIDGIESGEAAKYDAMYHFNDIKPSRDAKAKYHAFEQNVDPKKAYRIKDVNSFKASPLSKQGFVNAVNKQFRQLPIKPIHADKATIQEAQAHSDLFSAYGASVRDVKEDEQADNDIAQTSPHSVNAHLSAVDRGGLASMKEEIQTKYPKAYRYYHDTRVNILNNKLNKAWMPIKKDILRQTCPHDKFMQSDDGTLKPMTAKQKALYKKLTSNQTAQSTSNQMKQNGQARHKAQEKSKQHDKHMSAEQARQHKNAMGKMKRSQSQGHKHSNDPDWA